MPRRSLLEFWKSEFTGYTLDKFRQDLLAGLTVAAVALPLALAFGVASGATAAAGLVTAILGGLLIGGVKLDRFLAGGLPPGWDGRAPGRFGNSRHDSMAEKFERALPGVTARNHY